MQIRNDDMRMDRRRFLAVTAAAALSGCVTNGGSVAAGDSSGKPNFIFIITDDQRWDALGVVQREEGERARFPWFKTPAMDRLAEEGIRFRNAFVTHSLCVPSRASFLTGQYSHKHGLRKNHRMLPENAVTHASVMSDAGYTTAYVGKWHLDRSMKSGRRPPFDYTASFVGQGVYQDCDFIVNGETESTKGWVDDVSTTYAIEWLKENRDKLFSMVLGYKSPHNRRGGEFLPKRLRKLYGGKKSRDVPNSGKPAIYHAPGQSPHRFNFIEHQLDYLRHIKGVDENLGRLLKAIDKLGLAKDTVVVFAGDNGYLLGEHNCGDKRALYEESLRIPMLVRYPRMFRAGQVIDEMVLNVDLAPTFLDIAGLPVPESMQGRSWLSLMLGETPDDWRKSFVSHYYKELGDTPTCVAIRTETEKLILYAGRPEWTEAFNLADDPYEVNNLASDKTLVGRLKHELEEQMKAIELSMPL